MTQIETGSFTSSELTEAPTAIRVVSWNIARGSKLKAIIDFLVSADADIIFLQETDNNARRTGYKDVAKEIAQKLGTNYVFGYEFEELAQGSPASPAYQGQATLSRWPLPVCSILRFRSQSEFWRPRWFIPSLAPLQRRRGGRMALVTNVRMPGKLLVTYNLHFESRGSDSLRSSQLQEVLHDANRYSLDVPMLAAGDFNFDLSNGQSARALLDMQFLNPFAALRQATTTPHSLSTHGHTIDWILLRGPLIATNPQVHTSVRASDHYPISVTVHLT
jgi:endonuclease/exonuclease/phosphatase family metal-dependent hydrolase